MAWKVVTEMRRSQMVTWLCDIEGRKADGRRKSSFSPMVRVLRGSSVAGVNSAKADGKLASKRHPLEGEGHQRLSRSRL